MSSEPLTWRRSRLSGALLAVLAVLAGMIVVAGPAQRAAAATPPTCGVPGNLVQNCGFETGDLSGWQLTPAASGSSAGVVKVGRSGYDSAHFAATGATDDQISQSIAGTRPGFTYVVQFWLRNHDTTQDNHFSAQVTGKKTVTLLDRTNADSFGWTLFTGKFVAGSSAPTLTFAGRSAQNSILLDDVTVAPATNDCRDVPGNLVANCGFEARLASWIRTPAGSGETAGAISTPHSGIRSAYFTAGGSSDDQLSQTLSGTIAGSTYLVQFWVRNEAATTTNHFRAQVSDTANGTATLLEQTDAAPYNFTLFTGSFVAGTGAPTLTFAGRNSTTFYLDDVSVVREAPTPNVALQVRPHALVATVTSRTGTPTGSVDFAVDGTSVGSAPLSAGKATLQYTVPTGAARTVTATYSGDDNFGAASATVIRRDPTITARVTSAHRKTHAGWYRSPISVHFTCTTHGAPLTRPCPATVTITRNGTHKVTRTIRATDGGADTVRVTRLNLDRTAPQVRVRGVRDGGVYAGHAPRATCVAHDRLSGVASCRIRRHTHLTVTRYTAVATDRAGNRSTVTGRYRVPWMFLAGTRFANHAWQVRPGHSYRLVVTHRSRRPRYVPAAPWPRKPSGTAHPLRKAGPHRWAITVRMPRSLGHHRTYSLGVLAGGKMHRLRFRTR